MFAYILDWNKNNTIAVLPSPLLTSLKRSSDDFLFVQSDGSRWKRSDQTRPIKDALKKAGLPPNGSIYALRHTYVSHAIEGGVPLNVIAENCGTSVRMIEKTYAKVLAEKRRDFIERGTPSRWPRRAAATSNL